MRLLSVVTTIIYNKSNKEIHTYNGKIGKLASEEVTLELVKTKCMPILLYGLECYTLLKADIRSLDFAWLHGF